MSKSATYLAIVAVVALLVTVGVAAVFLKWSGDLKTQSYTELIENQTSALSDRISLYLARGMSDVLANTLDAMLFTNDVIYIQVIHNGVVVADKRKTLAADLELEPQNPDGVGRTEIRQLPSGSAFIDVTKELFPFPSTEQNRLNGYVRLGRSLAQLEAELNTERLIVVGIGALVVLALTLAAWWGIRWLHPQHGPMPHTGLDAGAVSDTQSASGLTESGAVVTQPERPRPDPAPQPLRRIGQLAIDDMRKVVEVRGETVELSPKEFDLLKLLCREPGKVYSNDEILKNIWAEHSFASAQDVKQYIYFLRRKLEEDPKKPAIITTVRGFGYKVESAVSAQDSG